MGSDFFCTFIFLMLDTELCDIGNSVWWMVCHNKKKLKKYFIERVLSNLIEFSVGVPKL